MQPPAPPANDAPNPAVMKALEPHRARREITILTNFFSIVFGAQVKKYSIHVESPSAIVSEQLREILSTHILKNKENRAVIETALGLTFVCLNNAIYSTSSHVENIVFDLPENSTATKITIEFERNLDQEKDADVLYGFYGRMVRSMTNRLGLKQIGRKMFDPSKAFPVEHFELWPGFSTAFIGKPKQYFLNIDMATKVVRQEDVLTVLSRIRERCHGNFEQAIREQLVGKSIMTSYNKRFYSIKAIDLNMTPLKTFAGPDGSEVSFVQYYQKKYNVTIRNTGQPMIVSEDKKTRHQVFLVPELCQTTGLNDNERANRNLMTQLDGEMKPEAGTRLMKSMRLLDTIKTHPKTKATIQDWKIDFKQETLAVKGKLLDCGRLLFGQNQMVNIENTPNLDREMQKSMFAQTPFAELVMFFASECTNEFNTFNNLLQRVLEPLNLRFNKIIPVEIQGYNNLNNIKNCFHNNLRKETSACLLIIPGRKKQGKYYDEIKRLLNYNYPLPSQVVLASTIATGKNTQSIMNKIFVQIIAKMGSIPWAIDSIPFSTTDPTMVVGINNYIKPGQAFGFYTFVASMDQFLTSFFSKTQEGNADMPMSKFVSTNMSAAMQKFFEKNKILPKFVIIFREGVSKGQHSKGIMEEIDATKAILTTISGAPEKPYNFRLIFVVCSKTSNVKFFYDPRNQKSPDALQNPLPGTYVSEPIGTDHREFFLSSQRPTKGLLSPISYTILENQVTDIDKVPFDLVKEAIAKMTNKLCYLYYNTSNPIKVPAPMHLATRLAYYITEHSTPANKMLISNHLENNFFAYYL